MKTIRPDAMVGKLRLRLVMDKSNAFIGVIFGPDDTIKAKISGTDQDDVWRRLHDEAGKHNPKYFGFAGARNRFLSFFPDGFGSDKYVGKERAYKVNAKERLDATAPLEKAAKEIGLGQAVLAIVSATNMLSPYEQMRLKDVLNSPSADTFVQAAAALTLGEGKPALHLMKQALKPHNAATWPVATYLPFLWRPDNQMFLKPETTQDFANRVGHRFANDYESDLRMEVYDSLLDLAAATATAIADLSPRDRIDVQSFIWIVGKYEAKDVEEAS